MEKSSNKFKRINHIVRREQAQKKIPRRRMLYGFILGVAFTWFFKPYVDRYMQRRAEPKQKHKQVSAKNILPVSDSLSDNYNISYDSFKREPAKNSKEKEQ